MNRVRNWGTTPGGALCAAVLCSLLCWLILRQPQIRSWLCALVPHRYPIEFARQRQLLAPRSIAMAGMVLAMMGAVLGLFPKTRHALVKPLAADVRLITFLALIQCAIALAVVFDLQGYFIRTFGASPCYLDHHKVLTHWVPQAFPHAQQLRGRIPTAEHIALKVEGGTFNQYLLSAFAYPLRCYHTTVTREALNNYEIPSEWRARGIRFFVQYDPYATTEPLLIRQVH